MKTFNLLEKDIFTDSKKIREGVLKTTIEKHLLYSLTDKNKQDDNDIINDADTNISDVLYKLKTQFIALFNSHNLNNKKTFSDKKENPLTICLNINKDQQSPLYFNILLKYLFNCFLNDEKFEIIRILFPEIILLCAMNATNGQLYQNMSLHHLLGYLTVIVELNKSNIKKEVMKIKNNGEQSIFCSYYICSFIYNVRLNMIFLVKDVTENQQITNYFIFITFISYIRSIRPNTLDHFFIDEVLLTNFSFLNLYSDFSKLFYSIDLEFLNYSNKKVYFLKNIDFSESFLEFTEENRDLFLLSLINYKAAELQEKKVAVLLNYKNFINLLHKSTLDSLTSFFNKTFY